MSAQGLLFKVEDINGIQRITVNPSVEPEERERLSKQCWAVLKRLKQGPASNHDLATIALRYSARIMELRQAGFNVIILERDYNTGKVLYGLQK